MTRRRLIAAAEETFLSAGFISTTVDDITAAAGVSRATFYLHFANKGAILREIAVGFIPPTAERYAQLDVVLAGGHDETGMRALIAGERLVGVVLWLVSSSYANLRRRVR